MKAAWAKKSPCFLLHPAPLGVRDCAAVGKLWGQQLGRQMFYHNNGSGSRQRQLIFSLVAAKYLTQTVMLETVTLARNHRSPAKSPVELDRLASKTWQTSAMVTVCSTSPKRRNDAAEHLRWTWTEGQCTWLCKPGFLVRFGRAPTPTLLNCLRSLSRKLCAAT